jgi:hypothetical protein
MGSVWPPPPPPPPPGPFAKTIAGNMANINVTTMKAVIKRFVFIIFSFIN